MALVSSVLTEFPSAGPSEVWDLLFPLFFGTFQTREFQPDFFLPSHSPCRSWSVYDNGESSVGIAKGCHIRFGRFSNNEVTVLPVPYVGTQHTVH